MKKALIVASTASMILQFNIDNITLLQELGYTVEVACNFEEGNTCSFDQIEYLKKTLDRLHIKFHQVEFLRNPFKIQNFGAYRRIKNLLNKENYSLVHCHSPIGGVISRIASRKENIKMVYTAHGFHFYQGASWKTWWIYYLTEKILSYYTDVLITLNYEDYENAQSFFMKKLMYIPGIGIDTRKYQVSKDVKEEKRKEMTFHTTDIILCSIGELIARKNHKIILQTLFKLNNKNIHYMIIGQGDLKDSLYNSVKELKLEKQVHFLGYRTDIEELLSISDIYLFPSIQEGLPVALMEAMAAGLPIIASNIRGNRDLIQNGRNGFLVENKIEEYSLKIVELMENPLLRKKISEQAKKDSVQYDRKRIERMMKKVYESEDL
ncbi:glycosyltransferase family 1 protein [Fusobacterium necrophorum]|uniref:glycosyltransferase family 4 protein n=1 Tax=Fusobacterium necrophorum TaxID=859 RepID=UPI000890AC2A|nr:glycosyltransferase family 4 protein [Fusobacterium necrophorum]AYZ73057.1 glycosyltransferase family 1 protein [Fusobacterium necrophorum]AZW08945.1 glycosyltransferase family 1 protein [Fusobacterium necrophorum subsp. necrophorum]SDB40006.1 Glycosyltransferase involved in cell wall bisynthesis [Fusobacterium necrophorum]SQD09930.1 Spore coat protein SA [Fusobacterium necrophorum subsp. necrophorum]